MKITFITACSLFGIQEVVFLWQTHTVSAFLRGYASLFQMLLRSASRVTRSLSGISCTSGVPWHPPVANSSFWCSSPSVRMENWPAGDNSNYWSKRTFAREQFLVKYRSKTTWSRNSLISPCHVSPLPLHPQTPLLSPPLALNSSFSSKPSKENSPKQGIIAR